MSDEKDLGNVLFTLKKGTTRINHEITFFDTGAVKAGCKPFTLEEWREIHSEEQHEWLAKTCGLDVVAVSALYEILACLFGVSGHDEDRLITPKPAKPKRDPWLETDEGRLLAACRRSRFGVNCDFAVGIVGGDFDRGVAAGRLIERGLIRREVNCIAITEAGLQKLRDCGEEVGP